jgi:hypothetical protein
VVFTLNSDHREEDIHHVWEKLPGVVAKLRAFSPVWKKIMEEEKKDETLHPEPVRHPAHAGHGPAL